MERLTSNKDVSEMGMVELIHNSCYIENREAWYRDYDNDISARMLARLLLKIFAGRGSAFTSDEDFDEYMAGCLKDGFDSIEGLIALLYRNLRAMADLHAYLKYYEDLQEQGRLLELENKYDKVTIGTEVFIVRDKSFKTGSICNISEWWNDIDGFHGWYKASIPGHRGNYEFEYADFGKTVFLTREEAEEALKRMEDGNETD